MKKTVEMRSAVFDLKAPEVLHHMLPHRDALSSLLPLLLAKIAKGDPGVTQGLELGTDHL